MPRVRPYHVFDGAKKIAEAFDKNYGMNSGATRTFDSDGYACHAEGAGTSDLTLTEIVPVGGKSVDWVAKLFKRQAVDIGIPLSGKYHRVRMTVVKNGVKANTEKGTCEGEVTLEGGEPNVT